MSHRLARIDAMEAELIATNDIYDHAGTPDRHFDRDGRPITFGRWVALMEVDPDYKIVAQTTIGDTLISTVWLGLDHDFFGDGPPVIFETMVFGPADPHQEYQERYSTEAEAVTGHDAAIRWVREHQ